MSEPAPETETVQLYVLADGLTGRGGGPYLDQEEQRIAEERRAVVEGREPDYENLPASAGTVLGTASELLAAASVNVPSLSGDNKTKADAELVSAIAASESSNLEVHSEVPAEAFTPAEETKPEEPEEPPVEESETPANQPAGPPEEDPFAGTEASSS